MNYHQILGVPANATDGEIKQAFRKKAKQLHPDKNKAPDAAQKFQELLNAYEILINKKLKPRPHYTPKKPLTREEIRKQKIAEINLKRKQVFEKKLADFNRQNKKYTKSFYVSRNALFLSAFLLLMGIYFINHITFILQSEQVKGKVVSVSTSNGFSSVKYVYPLVEFSINEKTYIFRSDVDNPNYLQGDVVTVIYKKENPSEAYIYTFTHFWAKGLGYLINPLFLLYAVFYSLLARGDKLQVNTWPIKMRIAKAAYLNF